MGFMSCPCHVDHGHVIDVACFADYVRQLPLLVEMHLRSAMHLYRHALGSATREEVATDWPRMMSAVTKCARFTLGGALLSQLRVLSVTGTPPSSAPRYMPPGLVIDEDQSIPFLLALYGQVDGLAEGVQKQLKGTEVLSALLTDAQARGPWTSAAVAAAEAVHLLLQLADMYKLKSVGEFGGDPEDEGGGCWGYVLVWGGTPRQAPGMRGDLPDGALHVRWVLGGTVSCCGCSAVLFSLKAKQKDC
jgi:hypothetical protein